jgi:hypothetical protein
MALIISQVIIANFWLVETLVSIYMTKVCILSVAVTLPNSVEKKWDSTSVAVQRKLCHFCYKHLCSGLLVLVLFIVQCQYMLQQSLLLFYLVTGLYIFIAVSTIFSPRRSVGFRFSVKYLL